MQNFIELANEQIKRGKSLSLIKESLTKHFRQEDENKFYSDMRVEYDELFPEKWILIKAPTVDDLYDKMSISLEDTYPSEKNYKQVENEIKTILDDVKNNTNNSFFTDSYCDIEEPSIPFEQYKNETKTVQEKVEATYDEDGTLLTEEVPEIVELVRPYIGATREDIELKVNEYLKSIKYISQEAKEAKAYLDSTDWYVVRKSETGVEIPEDILAKRQIARDTI